MTEWTGIIWLDSTILISIVIILSFTLSTMLRRLINRNLIRDTRFLGVNITKYTFLKNVTSLLVYTVALIIIFYSIPKLRNFGTTIFAGAGIIAAVLAFASKEAFSNIIGGVFIIIFKPFRVGDWVLIANEYHGVIEDINLRHTRIRDFEHQRIIIPNTVISTQTIVNSHISDTKIRKFIEIPISFDSDINLAEKIMQEEYRKHPLYLDIRTEEQKISGQSDARVCVLGYSDSSVNLRLYAWVEDPDKAWTLSTDLYKSIKERFDRAGVEIPLPYRNVVMKENRNHEEKNS